MYVTYPHRMRKVFKHAYQIAVRNFDSPSIVSTCVVFIELLGMDSWHLRVDIESANYIVRNWQRKNDGPTSGVADLKKSIGKIINFRLGVLYFYYL